MDAQSSRSAPKSLATFNNKEAESPLLAAL